MKKQITPDKQYMVSRIQSTSKLCLLSIAYCLLSAVYCFSQNISINATGAAPDPSSILDVSSTSQGLLIPRMTTAQRSIIASPVEGLMIYNTTTQCFEAYNAATSAWVAFGCIGCQLPGTFSANAATNINCTSFDANWNVSAGATSYFLDVSTVSSFSSFVAGYNNLSVGNVTTFSITGLSIGATYLL